MKIFCRNAKMDTGVVLLVLAMLFVLLTGSTANAICVDPPGDVTEDGSADVLDVQCVVLTLLWTMDSHNLPLPVCLNGNYFRADVTCNEWANVADAQIVISIALGLPLSPILDSNGDKCPDTCGDVFCSDDICSPEETCFECPEDCEPCVGSCCSAKDSPGCDEDAIQLSVCLDDKSCCMSQWTQTCVDLATEITSVDCPSGTCCVPTNEPGCVEPNCEDCVCEADPYCCLHAWDLAC